MIEALRRIGLMLAGMAVLAAVVIGAQQLLRHKMPSALDAIILLALAFGVYLLYIKLVERRTVDELAPALLPQALLGLVLGVAIFSTVVGLLAMSGQYHFAGFASVPGLLTALLVTSVGAVREELFFRGFLFRVVQSIGGTWIALAVSAIIFGALHLLNPHATMMTAISVAIEGGVLLAVAYVASRNLWLPMGIHLGWNFSEGTIFGLSDHPTASILHGALNGPAASTGGSLGIEGSAVAMLVCCVASGLFVFYALRKGRIVPMP